MTEQDVRWQQRFHPFTKAFLLLKMAIELESMSIVERAGLIQFFKITMELSWKLLKDYQEAQGYVIS